MAKKLYATLLECQATGGHSRTYGALDPVQATLMAPHLTSICAPPRSQIRLISRTAPLTARGFSTDRLLNPQTSRGGSLPPRPPPRTSRGPTLPTTP
jgi:hypothetical protein